MQNRTETTVADEFSLLLYNNDVGVKCDVHYDTHDLGRKYLRPQRPAGLLYHEILVGSSYCHYQSVRSSTRKSM